MLGRLLNIFIYDANKVFVAMSIVFSGLTVVAIYYLGKNLYDRNTGLLAAVLAISSPNLWFHGEVALSYVLEAFFSTLVALMCWQVINGRHGLIWALAVVLAVAGGFRQNTPVFLFPLWLYSIKSLPPRKILASFIVFVLVSLSWFVPMILVTGGVERYRAALAELREFVLINSSVFEGGLPILIHHSMTIARFVIYGVGAGFAVLGLAIYVVIKNGDFSVFAEKKSIFCLLWVLPSILFYMCIFIHYANPGYALIFTPCLLILTAIATKKMDSVSFPFIKKNITPWISTGVVVMNGILFVFCAHPVSYRAISDHNVNLPIALQQIRKYDPAKTAVLAPPYINYSFRPIMCYLPEYRAYNVAVEKNRAGEPRKAFAGIHGETFLEPKISLPDTLTKFAAITAAPETGKGAAGKKGLEYSALGNSGLVIISGPIDRVREVFPALPLR
jgi:hypothetical protein